MKSLTRATAVALAATAIALLGLAFNRPQQPRFSGMVVNERASEFVLEDQDGAAFRLADQRGSVVVLFFGYAHCTDVCPATLDKLAKAMHRLAPRQRNAVRVAFITVDPNRDTAPLLRRYVRAFDSSFYGLTGSATQLETVYHAYGVWHKKHSGTPATGYEVGHSTAIYFIDRRGILRVEHGADDTVTSIAHDIAELAS